MIRRVGALLAVVATALFATYSFASEDILDRVVDAIESTQPSTRLEPSIHRLQQDNVTFGRFSVGERLLKISLQDAGSVEDAKIQMKKSTMRIAAGTSSVSGLGDDARVGGRPDSPGALFVRSGQFVLSVSVRNAKSLDPEPNLDFATEVVQGVLRELGRTDSTERP